jgi:pimeloyl-ACP methyl ester carboxylesterase
MTTVRRVAALSVIGVALAACAAPDAGTPSPSPSPSAGRPGTFTVEVGELMITGHCTGTRDPGEPAVVLQHGNGGSQGHLAGIEAYMAELTQVCAYDRPGGSGSSDPPAQRPRTVTDVAAEAHGVLLAAGIEPPYFLVGQSAGAAITVVFAHLYADEVAGFVASNPNPPFTAWIEAASEVQTPAEIEEREMPDYLGQNPEGIDMRSNDVMLEPLPATMPFAIVFDEDCGGAAFCDAILEPLAATQARLAEVGAGGRFLWLEGAGHEIPQTRPDEFRAVIEEVWAEATD